MEEKETSISFDFFDQIREGELQEYDIIIRLKELTDNYDFELLNALDKDLSFYLFNEQEEMESRFSGEDIDAAISERKKNGLEIPLRKPLMPKNAKLKLEIPLISTPSIDLEKLLFPFEFYLLYRLSYRISNLKKENPNSFDAVTPLQWQGTQTELIELVKALIQAGKVKGTQTEIITTFSKFFQKEINNPDKILQDIKKRNNGSETLLLDNLKKSLLDYFQK